LCWLLVRTGATAAYFYAGALQRSAAGDEGRPRPDQTAQALFVAQIAGPFTAPAREMRDVASMPVCMAS
jgi:hypothetical protein